FTQLAIIEPNRVYQSLHPPAPDAPLIQLRGQKGGKSTPRVAAKPASKPLAETDPDEENEVDRNARYRVGALGALTNRVDLLRPCPKDESNPLSVALENIFNMVGDPYFWSCLYGGSRPPWLEGEDNVSRGAMLGTGQPVVRKSAWNIIPALVRKWGGKS
ncbi:listerin E3 ubiquitin protein ligase 1, partial [Tulasnella sp. 427]